MKYNSGVNNCMRLSKPDFEEKLSKIEAFNSTASISRTMSPVKKSKTKNKNCFVASGKSKTCSFSKPSPVSPMSCKQTQKKSSSSICDTPKSGNSAYRAKSLSAKAPRTQKSDPSSDEATHKEHTGSGKLSPSKMVRRLSACSDERQSPSKHMPVYDDTRKFLDVVIEGELSRLNFCDRFDIVTLEELVTQAAIDSPLKEASSQTSRQLQKRKVELTELIAPPVSSEPVKKLNEAVVTVLSEFAGQVKADQTWQAERKEGYYRYVETTAEELDEEVEYDMDEEDFSWLELYNGHRRKQRRDSLTEEAFEFVIDRLEKEVHYIDQVKTSGATKQKGGSSGARGGVENDEDAVCSICLDDECQNLNAILFCDRCNLAVHQDCYGVPYVPEGEWLCRKCQRSPTQTIHCCLCPRTDGAMKQTDDGRWCHVLCALWIPEVGFGSVESLEPITKIDKVPSARRKLTCSICKKREVGASIQCMKKNCYTAFHVSCAQQIGIYMKIEPVHDDDGAMVNVHKTILCNTHRPSDSKPFEPMIDNSIDSDPERPSDNTSSKGKVKVKVKNNRLDFGSGIVKKGTNKKNQTKDRDGSSKDAQMIPLERLTDIADSLVLSDRYQVVATVRNYWKLKRSSRNGMALLRRLQTSTNTITCDVQEVVDESGGGVEEAVSGLVALKKLRNEMEKVRLLLELIRKREKLKRELALQHVKTVQLQITPCAILLYETLEQLQAKDEGDIFALPVNIKEIPEYFGVIKKPMDFSTMRSKIDGNAYCDLRELEKDFNLMIKNCIKFNARDTAYYRLAIKLRKKGHKILAAARALEDAPTSNSGPDSANQSLGSTTTGPGISSAQPLHLSHHSALDDDSSDEELETPKKKKTFKKVLQNKNKVEKKAKPKTSTLKVPKPAKISKLSKSAQSPSKNKTALRGGKRPLQPNSYKSWISNKRKKLMLESPVDDVNKSSPQQKKSSDSVRSRLSKSPSRRHTVESVSGLRLSGRRSRVLSSDSIVPQSRKRTRSQESSSILSTPPARTNTAVKRRKLSLDVEEKEKGPKSKSPPVSRRTRRLSVPPDGGDTNSSLVSADSTKISPSSTELPRHCASGSDDAIQSASSAGSSPQLSVDSTCNGCATPDDSRPLESLGGNHRTDQSMANKDLTLLSLSKDDVGDCVDTRKSFKTDDIKDQKQLARFVTINGELELSEVDKEKNSSTVDGSSLGGEKNSSTVDGSSLGGEKNSSNNISGSVATKEKSKVNKSDLVEKNVDGSGLDKEKNTNVDTIGSVEKKNNLNVEESGLVEEKSNSNVDNGSDLIELEKNSSAVDKVLSVTDENQEDAPPVLSRCPSPAEEEEEEEKDHPVIERYDSIEEEVAEDDQSIPARPPTLIKSDEESGSVGEPALCRVARDVCEQPPHLTKLSNRDGNDSATSSDSTEGTEVVVDTEPPLLVKSDRYTSENYPELTSIQEGCPSTKRSECRLTDTVETNTIDECSIDIEHSAPPQLDVFSMSDNVAETSVANPTKYESSEIHNMAAALSPHVSENSDSTCTSDSSCGSPAETLTDINKQTVSDSDVCNTTSKISPTSACTRSGLFDRFSMVLDASVVVTETDSSYGSANSDSEQSRSKCNSPEYSGAKTECGFVRPPINNNLMAGAECRSST